MTVTTTPSRRPYAARLAPELRREQLLDAALDLVLDRGFHALTIDAVARAAGVTRPVVYGVFADRGDLLTGLLDREQARATAQLSRAMPSVPSGSAEDPGDPLTVLLVGLTAFWDAVAGHPRTWRVILTPPEGAPDDLAERFAEERDARLHQLRELVEWGTARLVMVVDVDLFARSVQGLSEGAARLILTDPQAYPVSRLREFAATLLPGLVVTGEPG